MKVEVIYISQHSEFIANLDVYEGITLEQAILHSGLLEKFPEVSLGNSRVGIFGKEVLMNTLLKDGDRVEVYRPLKMDPMQARRLRATI